MPLPLRYNWRSLVLRKGRAVLTSIGIGLAVLVALLMFALSLGITRSIKNTGHPLNVLVTAKGAETIEFSALDQRVLDQLRYSPHVAQLDDTPLASPEIFFATAFSPSAGQAQGQALIRGVLPVALAVHEQVELVEGRFPSDPGEIMVGPLVAAQLGLSSDALRPGRELVLENQTWRIVGTFRAPGTVFESEIWGPLDDLMVATRRQELNAVVLRARDQTALDELLFDLDFRTDVLVASRLETDYYAAYADAFRPIGHMVTVMAGLLTLGGVFIGMNTLFAALAGRTREIGMLRTLGYRRWHLALAFMLEGLLPALIGGLLACLAALAFHGVALRIPMGAFRLEMDPALMALGLLLGVGIGLLGSVFPVWRAVRLKTIDAIRHL